MSGDASALLSRRFPRQCTPSLSPIFRSPCLFSVLLRLPDPVSVGLGPHHNPSLFIGLIRAIVFERFPMSATFSRFDVEVSINFKRFPQRFFFCTIFQNILYCISRTLRNITGQFESKDTILKRARFSPCSCFRC